MRVDTLRISASELPEVERDTTLIELLEVMTRKETDLALVTQRGDHLGVVSLENILLHMLEFRRRLSDILNEGVGSFTTPPKYVLSHEADHDELRQIILEMEAYEPIFIIKDERPIAVMTLSNMLSSLSFIKPLFCEIIAYSRSLGTLVAPNTSIKGCIKRMVEDNSKHAIVHRKGKVLGLINYLDIVNCLTSKDTLGYIKAGVDDYFFYTTCSTVMKRNFEYLVIGDYDKAYQMLVSNEYLIVLDSHRGKRLIKFMSVGNAFVLLQETLKRHF